MESILFLDSSPNSNYDSDILIPLYLTSILWKPTIFYLIKLLETVKCFFLIVCVVGCWSHTEALVTMLEEAFDCSLTFRIEFINFERNTSEIEVLRVACSKIAGDDFFVLTGYTIFDFDFASLFDTQFSNNAIMTVAIVLLNIEATELKFRKNQESYKFIRQMLSRTINMKPNKASLSITSCSLKIIYYLIFLN